MKGILPHTIKYKWLPIIAMLFFIPFAFSATVTLKASNAFCFISLNEQTSSVHIIKLQANKATDHFGMELNINRQKENLC